MNNIRLLSLWTLLCVGPFLYAQETLNTPKGNDSSAIYVRYEPAPGSSKTIRLRAPGGSISKVRDQFVQVDNSFSKRLKRRSSATFWYDVIPTEQSNHYVIRSHTHKNVIGVSGSYLFYGDFTHHNDWLRDELKDNFEGDSFGLRDFSVGLLYARQLCAKNRHRLSFEIAPAYRQIEQSFLASSYNTSYASTDPNGLDYDRLIHVTNYEENVSNYCASVPLDIRYDFFIFKYLSLFLAGGIDNVFAISKDSYVNFDALYAGRYGEEYFNVVIEDGYYDFGNYPENIIRTESDIAFRYNLYGTAMAGIQLFIGPVLSLEVAGVYHRMLYSNIPDTNIDNYCLSKSSDNYESMALTMKPESKNRLGINVKLKFNF